MPGMILTLPIVAGKVEAWRRFCQELSGSRQPQHEASRRRLGITAERFALVEGPFGAATVTTVEADDVGLALAEIIGSDLPFESWYRDNLQHLHGVNLTGYQQYAQPTPPDERRELLFEWTLADSSADSRPRDGCK
jgi:hypothetical protein